MVNCGRHNSTTNCRKERILGKPALRYFACVRPLDPSLQCCQRSSERSLFFTFDPLARYHSLPVNTFQLLNNCLPIMAGFHITPAALAEALPERFVGQ